MGAWKVSCGADGGWSVCMGPSVLLPCDLLGSEAPLVPRTSSRSGVQFGTMPGEHGLLRGCEKKGTEDGRDSLPVH